MNTCTFDSSHLFEREKPLLVALELHLLLLDLAVQVRLVRRHILDVLGRFLKSHVISRVA